MKNFIFLLCVITFASISNANEQAKNETLFESLPFSAKCRSAQEEYGWSSKELKDFGCPKYKFYCVFGYTIQTITESSYSMGRPSISDEGKSHKEYVEAYNEKDATAYFKKRVVDEIVRNTEKVYGRTGVYVINRTHSCEEEL